MKKEIRQKTIDYEVFISDDGKEYDNKEDAILHDKLLKGDVKECPNCNGRGWIFVKVEDEDYHTGAPITRTDTHTCKICNGKGYLEKKLKEVWE